MSIIHSKILHFDLESSISAAEITVLKAIRTSSVVAAARPDNISDYVSDRVKSEALLDGGGSFFITGLLKEGKHVFLVCLHTGLIEGIDPQHISADTASLFEEVEKLTEITLAQGGDSDADIGHTAVNVGYAST